jgi:hypothetical protein
VRRQTSHVCRGAEMLWERGLKAGTARLWSTVAAAWLACVASGAGAAAGAEPPREQIEFFEQKIRPLLVKRCYECHSERADPVQGGLRLDSRAGVQAGGDSGPAVVSGRAGESLLIEAVEYAGDRVQMPPEGQLPGREIALLREWVDRGVPMPADTSAVGERTKIDFEAGREFWSFQPVVSREVPAVRDTGWAAGRVDRFVLAALESRGLTPSDAADERTLLRRLSFDVTGLPPLPDDVKEFAEADTDELPGGDGPATVKWVDRLLASPHYGERWGRYWLDLARYSDKTASWLSSIESAWLYRDWVVRALNEDLPYDDFVRRQLATDLMPGTGPEDTPALGFLGLSPVYWKELMLDPEVIKGTVAEEWEERIDAVGRTFLGLTLACARCHDHKFDPISTEDYYALAGVMAGTRLTDRPIIPANDAAVVRQAEECVRLLEEQIKRLDAESMLTADDAGRAERLKEQTAAIAASTPRYGTPWTHAVDEAAVYVLADGPNATRLEYKPGESLDLHVQIRGNPSNPGPLVPRRFLTVLSDGTPDSFGSGSGRRELAEAIVTDAASLAARVIVNRVWEHHFGRGLVDTPSDFGSQGSRPTHPELLDDLAARFIEHEWSIKWLHREILLSAAYRQSSRHDAANFAADPEDRWLWRMPRRRLEIEPWRDAMLAVAGTLERRIGGSAIELKDAGNHRRTIYGKVDRYDLNEMLRIHDFPDPLAHSPMRPPTTTALQQLFVLNGPLIERQAQALTERVAVGCPDDLEGQIRLAYRLLYGREATDDELRLGLEFLGSGGDLSSAAAFWPQYAQVLLGSSEFLFVD